MKQVFLIFLHLPRFLCDHIGGKKHPFWHRVIVGALIGYFGVFLAHWAAHLENVFNMLAGDFVGYSFHAVGITPLIEKITETSIETEV